MSSFGGCATCDGRCCRFYLVLVSGHDIAGITNATGLSPHRFVVLFRDDEVAFELPGGSGARLVADGPTMSMALDRYYDLPARPRCVFLMELPDSQARCAVYSRRPAVCASFPFEINDGIASVRDDTICGPDSFRIAGHDLQSRGLNVARAAFEWRLHRVIIAHWNEYVQSLRPRVFSRAELFDYLLGADHRIGQLRSEYSDEEFAQLISRASEDDSGASAELDFLSHVAKALTLGKK